MKIFNYLRKNGKNNLRVFIRKGTEDQIKQTSNQNENPERKEEDQQKTISLNVKNISYLER